MTISPNLQEPYSPFDAIRREDEAGEYWSARELMPLLGYGQWRRFEDAIDRAQATCANSGHAVTSNFASADKVMGARGPARGDYRLSRYGAYLVAMNGDPRKPEIAAAQTYFAVRTREAEVAQQAPAPVVTDSLEVLRAVVDRLIEVRDVAVRAEQTALDASGEARVANARLDAIECLREWYSAVGWANAAGFRQSDTRTLARIGKIAGTIGRASGLEPGKVPDEKYGTVNSWPRYVWDEAYAKWANS